MKRALLRTFCILLFIAVFIPYAFSDEFWASKKSNKYHYPHCKWAQKIKPENLIKFRTPEEALRAGYIPCKVCRPPGFSKSETIRHKNFNYTELQTGNIEQRQVFRDDGMRGCDYLTGRVTASAAGNV